MEVHERWTERGQGWPTADELAQRAFGTDLLILPDLVEVKADGTTIASFREEAQAFRVDALRAGLTVDLVAPDGSERAAYREHAADWVLPVLLAGPVPVVVTLITNRIQRWMDDRAEGDPVPTVRYREAHIEDGKIRVRELEGLADEVAKMLLQQSSASVLESADDQPQAGDETS